MALRGNGVFHPNFFYMPRRTVETAMIAQVRISKPTGGVAKWTPGVGMAGGIYAPIWEGHARVQPNKDWRARPREQVGEFEAVHAIRVQLPIGKNEWGGTYNDEGELVAYGTDPEFYKDYMVEVIDTSVIGAEQLEGDVYYVRNAKTSANLWLYNLLCDTGTRNSG